MKPTKKKKRSLKELVGELRNKRKNPTKADKKSKKEQTTMANEVKKDDTTKVYETEKVETKVDGKDEKTTETKDETKKVDEKTTDENTDGNAETDDKGEGEDEGGDGTVMETPNEGNGIPIEELVTKGELREALAAMNSKMDAVIKENADLKEENAKLRAKYEDNGDFGAQATRGIAAKSENKYADSFDNYSKPYMK